MKRMLLIIFIMVFVAGGAIAALIVFEIIPNPFDLAEPQMTEQSVGTEGQASGRSFVPPEQAPILFPLEDLNIPVILDGRMIKRVYITARIEIAPGNEAAVENGLSRFESALNENLIVYFQDHFAKRRLIDIRGIKQVMVMSSKQVYDDMVNDVLLLAVFEQ